MSNKNYELRIISKDQKSDGRALKKYIIDGQEIVGVQENEPFEIEFKNNTWNKLEVRISIDGTDICTGGLASTEPAGEKWLCNPYSSLKLKAWPESAKGGSEFLFGRTEDSVAVNTHENMSGKGIIAAAVFVESYNAYNQLTWTTPVNINTGTTIYPYPVEGITIGDFNPNTYTYNSSNMLRSMSCDSVMASSAQEDLAVGAGDYVAQEIVKVAGLTKPKLNEIIQIKYESWLSLRSKVRELQKEVKNVSNPGFPGDVALKMIDLKSTPKGRNKKRVRTPDLERF